MTSARRMIVLAAVLGASVLLPAQGNNADCVARASGPCPQVQDPLPAKLTLAQVLQLAESNYPQIRAALEQQAAAEAGVGVARTAYLPRADVLWQTNRATANNVYGLLLPQSVIPSISGPVLPSDNGRSAWGSAGGALLSWQPFDFGLRRAQVDAAREGANAARAGSSLTRLDVILAAAAAFFDLASAEQLVAAAQANVQRLETFARAVQVLADNQLRPGADAAQADAGLALARTQLVQAQTSVAVRRAALARFLGTPAAQLEVDAAPLLSAQPADAPPAAGIAAHPAAEQQAALVNQQQARVNALDRSYVPLFNAQAALSGRGTGATLNGVFPGGDLGLAPNTLNWAAGVQVTFPALDLFSVRARKKVEEATLRADQDRYRQTLADLSAGVLEAEAQLDGARAIARNTPVELAAARQSEQQQRARFESGLATVIEVSAAESLLVQAESDDAVARLNVWRALAGVAAARGDLSPLLAQLK